MSLPARAANQEVLPPGAGQVRVVARPHPLRDERIDIRVPAGLSLQEILERVQPNPRLRTHAAIALQSGDRVWIVEPQVWRGLRPKAGCTIIVRTMARGPAVAIIGAIAASAAGAAAASAIGTGIFASVVGALVTVAVGFVFNLLVPTQKPKLPTITSPDPGERSPTLSGARNQARPFKVVPQVLGRHRVTPAYGAQPFTEFVGGEQYLRLLFVWGIGPYAIEYDSFKIGNTAIDEFEGITHQTRPGLAGHDPIGLFPRSVFQEDLSVALTDQGVWHTRTTADDTVDLSIDIVLPNGLRRFLDNGGTGAWTVEIQAQYAPSGSGSWADMASTTTSTTTWQVRSVHVTTGSVLTESATTSSAAQSLAQLRQFNGYTTSITTQVSYQTIPILRITADTGDTIRRSLQATGLTPGAYDVRVRLSGGATDSSKITWRPFWTALRGFQNSDPIDVDYIATTAVRLRASDRLNGVIDTFSGVVQTIAKDWDAGSGTWATRPTNNPASLFRHVLQGQANARPLPDSRIDLTSLQDWHEYCASKSFTFNAVIDFPTDIQTLLTDIAAAGRAVPVNPDGKWGVVIDREQSTPVQHFTPRNSWGFEAERAFDEEIHALRCQFVNQDADWQPDERVVYNDGYNAGNATEFRDWERFGITRSGQVYVMGRYDIATSELRREVYSLQTSVQHLVCTRGDLVRVTHDVVQWGLGSARVKTLATSGGNTTGVVLDELVTMEAGDAYALRFRLADGTSLVRAIETVPGETDTLTFTSGIATASGPQVGDLAMFGLAGLESVEAIVLSIEPSADLTARLRLVDYAPAVFTADTQAIPDFDPQITLPRVPTPPVPRVHGISSDESALEVGADGSLSPTIKVAFSLPGSFSTIITTVEAQIRETGQDTWARTVRSDDAAGQIVFRSVVQGRNYDIRLRSISRDSVQSGWTTVFTEHVSGAAANPPDDVSGFAADVIGGTIHLAWDAVGNIDLVSYELRYSQKTSGASWAAAQFLARADKRQTTATAPARNGTYFIRARDAAGRYSLNDTTIQTTAASLQDLNVVQTLQEDTAFSGEKTNVIIDSSALEIDDRAQLEGIYLFNDGATTDVDLGQVYDCLITPDIEWTATDSDGTLFDDKVGLFDDATGLFDGEALSHANVRLQINASEGASDLFDDATGLFDDRSGFFDGPFSGWQDVRLGVYRLRFANFRLVLESDKETVTPVVSRLRVTVDMPDRVAADLNIASGAGTKAIAFSPAFKETPSLGITAENMATGDYYELAGQSRTGFNVTFRNSAGTAVDRTFDWVARGYGREIT